MVIVWQQKSLRPVAIGCRKVAIGENRKVVSDEPRVSVDPQRERKGDNRDDTDRPIKLAARKCVDIHPLTPSRVQIKMQLRGKVITRIV